MKKIFLLCVIFLQSICYAMNNEGIITYDLIDAIAISEKSNKEILVIFTADWCEYCNIMKQDLLECSEIKNKIICYINIDKNPSLKKQYNVRSIPDYFLLKDKLEIKRQKGYHGKKEFIKWLNK